MQKKLDAQLHEIRTNPHNKEFILCYAADPDMGAGLKPFFDSYPNLQAYYDSLAALVQQAALDIMLTSVSTMDVLARDLRLFDESPVTPAIRANDATDIWSGRGFSYAKTASRPFTTATIEEARYGTLTPQPGQQPDVNLGLYSLTFNNDFESDWFAQERFREFRIEATQKGFRYFLEVFNPNAPVDLDPAVMPYYVNDAIARMLAGVPRASRPEFLKIAYNGPKAMEELCTYTSLVVGILGGPSSTTYDSYKLIAEAKKYGARVALFGRRIKDAEDPLAFVELLRAVADDAIGPEEATKAYHGRLQSAGIKAKRSLDEDMVIHTEALK
jgi:orotidine-5'-phosphate decarboxylase